MIGTMTSNHVRGEHRALPDRSPSVTMQREPTNAPSSTITGVRRRLEDTADADAAREVDVGTDLRAGTDCRHVSTIVRGPTQAPMFT